MFSKIDALLQNGVQSACAMIYNTFGVTKYTIAILFHVGAGILLFFGFWLKSNEISPSHLEMLSFSIIALAYAILLYGYDTDRRAYQKTGTITGRTEKAAKQASKIFFLVVGFGVLLFGRGNPPVIFAGYYCILTAFGFYAGGCFSPPLPKR